VQPLAGGELFHQALVQAAVMAIIDILQAGGGTQRGGAQTGLQTAVVALGALGVEQEAEVLLEAQRIHVGHVALSLQCARHAGQMQSVQFFDRGMGQHDNSPIVGQW
jgi:hypothetical protein